MTRQTDLTTTPDLAPEREACPPASSSRTRLAAAKARLQGCTARMALGLRRLQAQQRPTLPEDFYALGA